MRRWSSIACFAASLIFCHDAVVADSIPSNACGLALRKTPADLKASDAYACLLSTPFDAVIAKELLDYWKTTLKFQSTLAYLKDPPSSYQQPRVDILRGLDLIRAQVDAGIFTNQYAFEAAVQMLLYASHDGNLYLDGSVLGVFTFGAPTTLVSVSEDGHAVPKVYIAEDLVESENASPLAKINGEIAENFLSLFAAENSFGNLEPHGDWNSLMYSPVGLNQQMLSSLTETIFYPGDTFTMEFANGSVSETLPWEAYNIQGFVPGIETGEDFYRYFVLGQLPDTSANTQDGGSAAGSADTDVTASNQDDFQGWPGGTYPPPDVSQHYLGSGGYLTGYYLRSSKTAVLSIPSFALTYEASLTFNDTIGEFLRGSRQAGMENVVIDLQQNFGGNNKLATDTFRQFFPGIEPYSGMRTRSHHLANEIGNTFTRLLTEQASTLDAQYVSDLEDTPWAVTANEVNAETGAAFGSWSEYYGPWPDRNDQFSTVYREKAINADTSSGNSQPPYEARNILLLTDGACGGACDLFMEMMHHDAGVRTVAVGGLPQYGSMQARGAHRGAYRYSSDELDVDIETAGEQNETLSGVLPNRSRSLAIDQSRLIFNLADQMRRGENVPLQFVYEAADCRIFFTKKTFNNYTALWQHAADANWKDPSLCVPMSTEHNNTMITDLWGPTPHNKAVWAATNRAGARKNNGSISVDSALAQQIYDTSFQDIERRGNGQQLQQNPPATTPTFDYSPADADCSQHPDSCGLPGIWQCIASKVDCPSAAVNPVSAKQCKLKCIPAPNGWTCTRGKQKLGSQALNFQPIPGRSSGCSPFVTSSCVRTCYCETFNSANDQKICAAANGPGAAAVHPDVSGEVPVVGFDKR